MCYTWLEIYYKIVYKSHADGSMRRKFYRKNNFVYIFVTISCKYICHSLRIICYHRFIPSIYGYFVVCLIDRLFQLFTI